MEIDALRNICAKLPYVTEDIKWTSDLCFSVGAKMFCMAGLEASLTISFKVSDDEFEELASRNGIRPAPYFARYKWIMVDDMQVFSMSEWEKYISQSYALVFARLSGKARSQL